MIPHLSRRISFWLTLLALGLCGNAWADGATAIWRSEVATARILAENDAPAAYKEARRLQSTRPVEATPADQARLLNLLSRIEVYLALTEPAAAHAQQALDLAKQHADRVGQAEADLNIALSAVNQGRLDAMSAAIIHSMTVLDGVDRPDLLSEAMLRAAMMYRRQGQFDASVTIAMQALEMAQRSGNIVALAFAHQGMAISFEQSDQLKEAREHFMQMREQARAAHMRRLEAEAVMGLGRAANRLGDVRGGERLIREAINMFREVGSPFSVNFGLYALADSLNQQGYAAASLPLFDEVVATYAKYPNKIGLWWALNARSTSYQSLGRVDAASADAERAYTLAKNIGFPLYLSESAKRLAAIAAARGEPQRAYQLSVEAGEMAAKATRESTGKHMVELAQRYASENKQRQIIELNRRNERQTAELQKRGLQQRWLWTLLGGSIVILAGTAIFLLRLRRSHGQLESAHTQLQRSQSNQQAILDAIPDLLFELGLDGRYYNCNALHADLLVAAASDFLGKTVSEVMPQDAAEICLSALQEAHEQGISTGRQYGLPLPQGMRWFEISVARKSMAPGEAPRFIGLSRDITERKQMEDRLLASEKEFRTLAEHSPDNIARYDLQCRMHYVNPGLEKTLGKRAQELLGKTPMECNPNADSFQAKVENVIRTGHDDEIELALSNVGESLRYHHIRFVAERGPNGEVIGALAMGRDVTEAHNLQYALEKHEQEFRALVEHSPDTITRYDRECRRIYTNPRMQKDAGVLLEALMYKTPEEFPGGEQASAYQDKIRQVLANGTPGEFELTWRAGTDSEICSHIRLAPEFDPEGVVVSVLAVGRDITEIDAYRKQIHNLAFFDTLTNLPNRALLGDRVRQTVADASWYGHQFGLMLMDLDRFKEINDTLGHSVGDQVLCEAARRLQGCVRIYDTVARLGGDEFAALLPDVRSSNDLATIACKILDAFNHPFMVDGRELFVSTSIGIALYPDDSADVETLFRYADSAMYHAKQLGRNNFQFYSADLTEKAAGRMTIESDLRKALERHELELYYQPQVELTSGKTVGAEALLRWHHGSKGLITPDKFIPVAEETGLIVGIGEWVLHSVCQAAVIWNTHRVTPLRIAVNLSTRQFIRNDLVSTVQRILQETGCAPGWLKLEITESLLLEDSKEIASMLATFNSMGLAISIDDFGTGYSALSYLNRFPVSQIKIDRSFVQGIPNDHDKTELVKAMISIAQALDLELVAEGVETQEQADCLLAKGCKLVQGYLFGKPMPKALFEEFIADGAAVCAQDISGAFPPSEQTRPGAINT